MSLLTIMLRFRHWLKRVGTIALCAVAGIFVGCTLRYGCFTDFDFTKYVISRVQHIEFTCVPAVGITRNEMQQRFDGVTLYVLLEYDRNLKCDIARWYYQIGDSDVYYTFKYSYKSGLVESWKMQCDNGYYNWDFTDYLRPADMKTEPGS